MHRMFKISHLYFLLLALTISCNSKNQDHKLTKSNNSQLVQKIDSIGEYYLDKNEIMGFSVAVLYKDDTLYNKGFGFIDSLKTKPVSFDNIFAIASISKLIGSTVVMKLVDEEVLDLDNTLSELLPDFPNREQASKVTLRHLLSHTSGIQDYAFVMDSIYLNTGRAPSKKDYYAFFENQELMFEPGTNYSYTNSGYVLMAMIVEHTTNSTFQTQLDRVINTPHNLNIKLISEIAESPLLSTYFDYENSKFIHRPHWLWIKGDGGLTTTATDLAVFSRKWFKGDIISKNSFQVMVAPYELGSFMKSDYGLGVRNGKFLGEKVFGHTGGEQSTWAILQFFPEKEISIVVLENTNATPSSAMDISGDIALAVLEKGLPNFDSSDTLNMNLNKFIGSYKMSPKYPSKMRSFNYFMKENDSFLYRKRANSDSDGQKLFYLGNGEFTLAEYPIDRIIFDFTKEGKVTSFREYYNGFFMRIGEKVK